MLELPLLIASSLSHVNRQYIKMRRRRKWWNKLGGYPKVSLAARRASIAASRKAAGYALPTLSVSATHAYLLRSMLATLRASNWIRWPLATGQGIVSPAK